MSKGKSSKVIKRIFRRFSNSEQEHLVEENNRMRELLDRRNTLEELGLLTASIEHDIKSPLAVIDTILHIMRQRFQHNSEILADLEAIEKQKQRIYATATMIRVVRADATLSDLQIVKVNVWDFIHHCVKEVKQEVNISDIFFRLNVPLTRDSSLRRSFFVDAQPPLLQQAIVNILKNAIEAIHRSDRRRGVIDVTVAVESADSVRIEIRDNGCGIKDDEIPNLAKPYYTTKGAMTPNSGLGLFITDKIVKLHRGRIEIQQLVEGGISVSIILPQNRSLKNEQ